MLTSQDPLLIPLDILPSTTSSSFTVTPSLVTQWLSHFLPKQEEVTMICSRHGVTLKSFSDIDTNPSLHTVLQTPTSVFESYHFHVQDEKTDPKEWDDVTLELTFNLKDFKGLLSFADSMNLPISALFKGPGMPILFSVTLPSATTTSTTSHSRRSTASSSDLMNLEFIIATVQPFTSSSSSSSSSTHPVPLYPFSTTSSFTSMLPNGTPVSHVSASHVSATPGGSLDTTPLRPAATPASVTAFPFGPDTNEIVPGTPPDQEQTWETFF
ncbi:hypothetical protein HMI54_006364 [Coelomomyces lativittatus]|nr:hypothetical protein HMI54_006364 [Coelomomyces lativittatus]